MSVLPCPCPCPVNDESNPIEILPIGSVVPSPGFSSFYQLLSYPVCRLYYDFKGKFEGVVIEELQEELPEIAEATGISEKDLWLFFSQNGTNKKLVIPDQVRILTTLLFLALIQIVPLDFLLEITTTPTPHKSDNAWIKDGDKLKKSEVAPASYWVQAVGFNKGAWYALRKPELFTFRWKMKAV